MPNLITLTGPSGCGKSEIMKIMVQVNPRCKILPKFTTRPRRKDDDESIITVDEIPPKCDYVYEQYGEKYGISSRMLLQYLQEGYIPIVVVNDAETIKKLQRKFGDAMKSYFIHREKPSKQKLIEIFNKTRGNATADIIEKRYQKAIEIYSMYTNNINLFDSIILNTGEGFDEATTIVRQLLDSSLDKKRLSNLQGNKIIVISGSPGFGKKFLVQGANRVGCLQISKYTDRDRNPSDGPEMIFKDDSRYNLKNCKIQYKNFGNNYGIDVLPIWQNLIYTEKHQLLACSEIETLRELKAMFGELVTSIYVHSEMNLEEFKNEELKKGSSIEYIQNRTNEYFTAHRNYAEHFTEYDKSFIYTGSERELMMQLAGVMGYLNQKVNQSMKGEARG